MGIELPNSWQFLGSMWWLLHVVAIVIVFLSGFLIGRYSSEPEPDPVNHDELRRSKSPSDIPSEQSANRTES